MATEDSRVKDWIVQYKHFVNEKNRSAHLKYIESLTADSSLSFCVSIVPNSTYCIGDEAKGYAARFDEDTKKRLEALPEVGGQIA